MTYHMIDPPELARLQQRALIVGGIGLLAGVLGAFLSADQFFISWLIGFLFCLELAVGSLALLMLQHLSGGKWGLAGRRVFEAAARTLPFVTLAFIPILFALPRLFRWADAAAVQASPILQLKAPYLNVPFFLVRAAVFFAFWLVCAWLLTKWSAEQDRGETGVVPQDMVRFRKVSAPGLLFLVLTITFASVDWIMSLEPYWYSTIFGLLMTAGFGLTALAFAIVILAMVAPEPSLARWMAPGQFHDLGKLMLAFVMLWAYLAFSQFLIIWAGNLPEEIEWYTKRIRGGWGAVSILLIVGHFVLPFLLLLSRQLKRHAAALAKVAIFVIMMRLVELVWLVSPAFEHEGFPVHWLNLAVPIGLGGLWIFIFIRNLRSRALVPLNDPYLKEAFAHDAH